MLNACMIDGFGWFNEADYRRSWLFFDQVDYLFPTEIKGPLRMPAALASNPLFAVVRPRSSEATIEYLINESKSDAANLTYAKLVRALVPSADLEYASMVVFCDRELQIKLNHSMLDSVLSLSYLVNKLLLYSAITGAVPIFGRHYATEIVGYKIQKSARFLSRQRSAAIVETDRMTSISAIAAGLSLGFIQDQDLKQISAKQLLGFKEKTFRAPNKTVARNPGSKEGGVSGLPAVTDD